MHMAKDFLRVTSVESTAAAVNLIELDLPEVLDTVEFDQFSTTLISAVSAAPDQPWILDLTRVSYMGSAMLGLMVNVRQVVKQSAGRLVLCGMSPRLHGIFRACTLERLFVIAKARPDAVKAASSRY
jgi:anti-anti-sigma factor